MGQAQVDAAIQVLQSALQNQTISIGLIRQTAASLSVDLGPGKDTFVFYSGTYLPDLSANSAAISLASQSSRVAIIDQTDVANLLTDSRFANVLASVTGGDVNAANNLLSGGADSLWGNASSRCASVRRTGARATISGWLKSSRLSAAPKRWLPT